MIIFFFQAEDGIRDTSVTGVQTCALPISAEALAPKLVQDFVGLGPDKIRAVDWNIAPVRDWYAKHRSEERRVGKECRARWAPFGYEEKERIACASGQTRILRMEAGAQ